MQAPVDQRGQAALAGDDAGEGLVEPQCRVQAVEQPSAQSDNQRGGQQRQMPTILPSPLFGLRAGAVSRLTFGPAFRHHEQGL
jgi:hypothetical protein